MKCTYYSRLRNDVSPEALSRQRLVRGQSIPPIGMWVVFTGHLAPRLDNPLDIRLHGQLVSRVESYKYLGVLIDSKLDHSAWLKQKRGHGQSLLWAELVGGNKSHLAPLQTTINKGIRLFTGARLSTAIGPLLVETGIGSLLTRSLVSQVRLLERSVTKKHPSMPSALDPSFDQSRAHGTRYLMLARMDALWTARKAIQIGILVDTHPFSVDHCILCDQQLLSTSIAHLVVECEQVTGHRIQSGLVPAIQKSRLRLLGRALDPGVENVYTWLRGGVLNGEADLDQRWLDGDCGA
ncbi:hypothetical protein BASA60_003410 [Batrachochytrium salamandrivorans]|nr:hypothetical protein BASA60_003410 [Batrachochytrium salamandrivorans]